MRQLSHSQVIAMFKRVGEITLTTEHIDWLHPRVEVEEDGPCVYLWVEERPESAPVILYIGMTGATLASRCNGHSKGFHRSQRGKAHAIDLIARIKGGSHIVIYGLWPEPLPFAGELIPSQSSVEDWLIAATHPRPQRNRQRRKEQLKPAASARMIV